MYKSFFAFSICIAALSLATPEAGATSQNTTNEPLYYIAKVTDAVDSCSAGKVLKWLIYPPVSCEFINVATDGFRSLKRWCAENGTAYLSKCSDSTCNQCSAPEMQPACLPKSPTSRLGGALSCRAFPSLEEVGAVTFTGTWYPAAGDGSTTSCGADWNMKVVTPANDCIFQPATGKYTIYTCYEGGSSLQEDFSDAACKNKIDQSKFTLGCISLGDSSLLSHCGDFRVSSDALPQYTPVILFHLIVFIFCINNVLTL